MSLTQFEMYGDVSGEDAIGHSVAVRFDGARVTIDSPSIESAVAALSSMKHSRAHGAMAVLGPLKRCALSQFGNIEVELRVRGLAVARAGKNASATWLGRTLTGLPIEIHWTDVLRVLRSLPP